MKEKDESVKLKDHMLDTSVCLVKGGRKMEMAPWKRENNSELGGCTEVEINGAAGAGKYPNSGENRWACKKDSLPKCLAKDYLKFG